MILYDNLFKMPQTIKNPILISSGQGHDAHGRARKDFFFFWQIKVSWLSNGRELSHASLLCKGKVAPFTQLMRGQVGRFTVLGP